MTIDGLTDTVTCCLHEWLAVGPMIVASGRHIARVQITDCAPVHLNRDAWLYTTERHMKYCPQCQAFLPGELRAILSDSDQRLPGYPTQDAAERALSDALLAWARQQEASS